MGVEIRTEVTADRGSRVNWEEVWKNVFIVYYQLTKKIMLKFDPVSSIIVLTETMLLRYTKIVSVGFYHGI